MKSNLKQKISINENKNILPVKSKNTGYDKAVLIHTQAISECELVLLIREESFSKLGFQ